MTQLHWVDEYSTTFSGGAKEDDACLMRLAVESYKLLSAKLQTVDNETGGWQVRKRLWLTAAAKRRRAK